MFCKPVTPNLVLRHAESYRASDSHILPLPLGRNVAQLRLCGLELHNSIYSPFKSTPAESDKKIPRFFLRAETRHIHVAACTFAVDIDTQLRYSLPVERCGPAVVTVARPYSRLPTVKCFDRFVIRARICQHFCNFFSSIGYCLSSFCQLAHSANTLQTSTS